MICNAVSHRRRLSLQCAVLSHEIVVGEEQSQSGPVVLPSLREAVGQSAHAFDEIANRAVQPLTMRRTNLVHVWVTQVSFLLSAYYPGRRILPAVFSWGFSEGLNQLGEVDATP